VSLEDRERAAFKAIERELSRTDPGLRRMLAPGTRLRRAHLWGLWGDKPDNGTPPAGVEVQEAVVVGCDGRLGTDAAVQFAFREASLRSAPVIVVTAFYRPVDPDLASIETPESELRAAAREAATSALCRALSAREEDLPPYYLAIGSGNPWRLLLQHYGSAQLIVVGMLRRGFVRKLIHGGSVGSMLIKRAHVPVVVVPSH
jgi:nucleotide-binding universal stress UspA family protein